MRTGRPKVPMDDRYIPVTETGCWIWLGHWNQYGYASTTFKGNTRMAHRVVYEELVGKIPEGMSLCHKCDTRCCVNPSHMFIGTHQDNSDDCMRKMRHTHGSKSPLAKLTEDDVRFIRSSKESGIYLAKKFGVKPAAISKVRVGRSWTHV